MNIDGKEVELKSRVGASGAILASKKYKRGSFSGDVMPYMEEFIGNLDLEPKQEKELLQINSPNKYGIWSNKLKVILKKFNEFGGDLKLFTDELNKILKKLYPSLELDVNNFIQNNEFDSSKFTIEVAKQLAKEYYDEEQFDGFMISDPEGNFKYFPKDKYIDEIGKSINIIQFTDLIARVKI